MGNVEIAVYDIQGRKVDVLHNGWLDAGSVMSFLGMLAQSLVVNILQ